MKKCPVCFGSNESEHLVCPDCYISPEEQAKQIEAQNAATDKHHRAWDAAKDNRKKMAQQAVESMALYAKAIEKNADFTTKLNEEIDESTLVQRLVRKVIPGAGKVEAGKLANKAKDKVFGIGAYGITRGQGAELASNARAYIRLKRIARGKPAFNAKGPKFAIEDLELNEADTEYAKWHRSAESHPKFHRFETIKNRTGIQAIGKNGKPIGYFSHLSSAGRLDPIKYEPGDSCNHANGWCRSQHGHSCNETIKEEVTQNGDRFDLENVEKKKFDPKGDLTFIRTTKPDDNYNCDFCHNGKVVRDYHFESPEGAFDDNMCAVGLCARCDRHGIGHQRAVIALRRELYGKAADRTRKVDK